MGERQYDKKRLNKARQHANHEGSIQNVHKEGTQYIIAWLV
jgi:hypothetical protein